MISCASIICIELLVGSHGFAKSVATRLALATPSTISSSPPIVGCSVNLDFDGGATDAH